MPLTVNTKPSALSSSITCPHRRRPNASVTPTAASVSCAMNSAKILNESFSRRRKEARTAPPNATPSESASWLSENKTTPSMTFIRCWKSLDTNSVSPLFGRPFRRRDLPAYPDAPMRNARHPPPHRRRRRRYPSVGSDAPVLAHPFWRIVSLPAFSGSDSSRQTPQRNTLPRLAHDSGRRGPALFVGVEIVWQRTAQSRHELRLRRRPGPVRRFKCGSETLFPDRI